MGKKPFIENYWGEIYIAHILHNMYDKDTITITKDKDK